VAKLLSISRSQRFRLACSTAFVFLLAAQFLRSGSLWWGGLFAVSAVFLYFKETANMLSALPLFIGSVTLPFFFPHNLGTGITTLFALIFAVLFGVALGVKSLILIHRETLLEAGGYTLAYIALLLFFMQTLSSFFLLWIVLVVMLGLSFYTLLLDYRYAAFLTLIMSELAWIVAWLPIGFLNATSVCFALVLFLGDMMRENRISGRNALILGALVVLIFATSYWRI